MAAALASIVLVPGLASAGLSEADQKEVSARLALAKSIVARYESEAAASRFGSGWKIGMMNTLLALPSSSLQALASDAAIGSHRQMMQKARTVKGKPAGKLLGDTNQDLTFTPVTPCRLADTRNAGGPITGGTARGFAEESSGAQGGDPNCSDVTLNAFPEGNAYVLNITVVNMNTTGFVAVRPVGATEITSLVNYTGPGQQVNNFVIVQNPNTAAVNEFEVYAASTVDVIIDVFGIFQRPERTPLDCTTVSTTSTFLGIGVATCAAGYEVTGGGCQSNSIYDHTYAAYPDSETSFTCGFWPDSDDGRTIGSTLTTYARCCRTPGR